MLSSPSIVLLISIICCVLSCALLFLWWHYRQTFQKQEHSSLQEHHYYHLSQQLFQAVESLNQHIQNTWQHSQSAVHDSFQRLQKDAFDQASKQQLQTQSVFTDITTQLVHLNSWQQQVQDLTYKIHQLSKVLDHSTLKGKFGEMHLENLIKTLYPASWVQMQTVLPNNTRVDCLLSLGDMGQRIPIDAKFPLQTFKMLVQNPTEQEYVREFLQVMKKNISDISEKYIIPGFTTDYAVMFVPSDALLSKMIEFDDLLAFAQEKKVLLCSPQTLFWLLSTMKKFLLDFQLSRDSVKTLEVLTLVQQHSNQLQEGVQDIEKRSMALLKDIKTLKNSFESLDTLISSLQEIKENLEPTSES